MDGAFVKKWSKDAGMRPETLASKLGVSMGTLYNWFNRAKLDPTVVLALAQLGCVEDEKPQATSKVNVG